MGLVVVAIFTWPSDKVRVIFCDVGQGDGAIVMAGSFQMLIDTGSENNKMVECLGRYLPFWDKTIEAIIISHNDSDHSGGLRQVKEYYSVQNIYSGNLVKNDVIRYKEISFEILNPEGDGGNENDNSIVGLLNFFGKTVLFLGDVTSSVEQKLIWRKVLRQAQDINVIKISHHGSAEATSGELLSTIKPKEAIISVGKNNKFGHPTKVVLERLEKYGVKIRRTDREGDIIYQ
ncbi:MAG: MBL fold metallo-hydrolase [Microgenomates group bacterium]